MDNNIYDQIDLTNVNTASELCDTVEASLDLGDVDTSTTSFGDVVNGAAKAGAIISGVYVIGKGLKWVSDKTGLTGKVKGFFKAKKAEKEAAKAANKKP
jgi:hypothetical protein